MFKYEPSLEEKIMITNLFIGICKGLEELHGKGMVHGAMKIKNIFITSEGMTRIGNVGITKL